MRLITVVRRDASDIAARLTKYGTVSVGPPHWEKEVAEPTRKFGVVLRSALHGGTVRDNEKFWQQVVNGVIGRIASDEAVVRRIVAHPTLYAQVKDLVDEVCEFPVSPWSTQYDRFKVVLAFCETLKTISLY